MLSTLLMGSIAGVVAALVVSLIAYRLYQHYLKNTFVQQQGWEHAQEMRQQGWEIQQVKRATSLEDKVIKDVQRIKDEWDTWEKKDNLRVQSLEQQYEFATAQTTLEYTLEHLLFVEDASLPESINREEHNHPSKGLPIQLAGEDLSGRNLSRRYLGHANLRGALLTNANLFMADLSHACLVGADLTNADLSGANLVGADLSNAILTNTNMLVADVNNANLSDADISKARNLVLPQVKENVKVAEIDEDIDTTQPRLPSITKSSIAETPASPVAMQQAATGLYDIVRAQSLDAIPEPAEDVRTQKSSILSFPGILPETPFSFSDEAGAETSLWSSPLSDETLRMLEEVHISDNRPDHLHDDNFDLTPSQDTYIERHRVKAS